MRPPSSPSSRPWASIRSADAVLRSGRICAGGSTTTAGQSGNRTSGSSKAVSSGEGGAPRPAPGNQSERNSEVEEIPGEAVEECRLVRPEIIEYGARHPAAQGHAEQRHHEYDAKSCPDFGGRKILAYDEGIARHDTALKQAEQGRYHIKRRHAVEDSVEQQRETLRGRTEQERCQPADTIGDEARADAADNAEGHHYRQHLGTPRDPVTKIAAIGHDMDLGHRHRHAAGEPS